MRDFYEKLKVDCSSVSDAIIKEGAIVESGALMFGDADAREYYSYWAAEYAVFYDFLVSFALSRIRWDEIASEIMYEAKADPGELSRARAYNNEYRKQNVNAYGRRA